MLQRKDQLLFEIEVAHAAAAEVLGFLAARSTASATLELRAGAEHAVLHMLAPAGVSAARAREVGRELATFPAVHAAAIFVLERCESGAIERRSLADWHRRPSHPVARAA